MNATEVFDLVRASGKRHYVYILQKPGGDPFYVGIGTKRRILDHAIFAKRPTGDSHKLRVIRRIWRDGGDIDYRISGWFDERRDAELHEAEKIAQIGRRDIRTGPLANITAGGEGATGISSGALSRRSAKMKEVWAARDKVAAMAHLNTPAVRAKCAATRTGKTRGPYRWVNKAGPKEQGRKRLSEILIADPVSKRPGVAAKIAAALRGKTWTLDPQSGRRVWSHK